MEQQSARAQKGEIEFRRKLFNQQVEGESVFEDEFDGKEISKILGERMKKTLEQMALLKGKNIVRPPFVEIGAERCQRSLVMENDLDTAGAAVDISYDMLKSCDYYKGVFNKNKVPFRICCDANKLPFMTGSIPFVFCYQTLHHFPDPTPIVKEIYRVLSPGGYFAVNEEPFKKVLYVNLYKGKKIYSKEPAKTSKVGNIFNFFFSKTNCNEVEYGVIENERIPIGVWRQALSGFEDKQVFLRAIKNIKSELFNPTNYLKFLFAYLFGGEIHGICRKPGNSIPKDISIKDILICPVCRETGQESKLIQKERGILCSVCASEFPIVDGIVFLFSSGKFQELYPEIFNNANIKK